MLVQLSTPPLAENQQVADSRFAIGRPMSTAVPLSGVIFLVSDLARFANRVSTLTVIIQHPSSVEPPSLGLDVSAS